MMKVTGNNPTGVVVHNAGQKASWDDFKKEHFVKLLLDCSNNQGRKGWSQETWTKIAQQMNAKFPEPNSSIEQLKQLERDLKKLYKSIKEIVMQSGFEWDVDNCTVVASDAHWIKLFERDPKAKKWHRKILPYYAGLDALCEMPQGVAQGKQRNKDPLRLSLHVNSTCVPIDANKEEEQNSTSSHPRNQDEHLYFPKRPDLFSEQTSNFSHKRFRLAQPNDAKECESSHEGTKTFIMRVSDAKCDFSIKQSLDAFNELKGFESSDLMHVGEIVKDDKNREVFLSLRKDQRVHWLSDMITARKLYLLSKPSNKR